MWGVKVLGAVAIQIEGALVISVNNDDVGLIGEDCFV